ncbi:DUF3180 domain-containing protein [Gordonia sp. L191]|uniref:DUF3180 domain-containing protein n=1 Tax=Gordonia sp. L191 TaxID=2982699 RepID=UPI0024BF17C8|nr:DUF3180 domain-containing protein [Gordonia sp. L191]WHU47611.1 DUF3180 domain-containing protein [Gordonia sp. L191]
MSEPSAPKKDDDEHQGMGPTKPLDLALVAVIVGVTAWILVRYNYSSVPPIPALAGIVLYVLAVIEAVTGFIVRARVEGKQVGRARGQLHPLTAARVVALAKASAILGAIATGLWGGMLVFLLNQTGVTAAEHDTPAAVVGLIGGVLLTVAALWLEYCCRAPDDPDDNSVNGNGHTRPGPA